MADLVHHVISAGLERGKYYRVYVTQVNSAGIESGRSEPAIIRVGDVTGPPAPVLSVDTSYGVGGYHSNNGFVDVGVAWTTPECDDLWQYFIYTADHLPAYTGDGVYPKNAALNGYQKVLTGATNSFVLQKQTQGWLYIGIQAMDYSRNLSDIYVIKVLAEDTSSILRPTNPIHVEQGGIWSLRAWTECPDSSQIAYVLFYRDGWKQLAPVPFASGLVAEITDTLDAADGLTHWYTYRYLDRNGHLSPMSAASETVTACAINLEHINQVALEALQSAWRTETANDIDALRVSLLAQAQTTQALANQLDTVTESYNKLYDQYQLAAHKIELLSAKSETVDKQLAAMQTSITQNAESIELRALKTYVDQETNQVMKAAVAAIDIQADQITSVVTEMGEATSSITQLANQMQLKVDQRGVQAAIDMAVQNGLSVAQISADRIVLNGQLLIRDNARITGRLFADSIALVNADGSILWGSGAGEVTPAVTTMYGAAANTANAEAWNGWQYHYDTYFDYIPRPNITFSGICRTKLTVSAKVRIEVPKSVFAVDPAQYYTADGYDYTLLNNRDVELFFGMSEEAYQGNNWDDAESIGTGHTYLNSFSRSVVGDNVVFVGTVSYSRTFSLAIGELKTFQLWWRTRKITPSGQSFPAIPGVLTIYDRTYIAECL